MRLSLLNASVVVVAEEHNPSILHPAFLTSQHIVPGDWELAEPPVCTPPLSFAKYANGIVFTVESAKFQVVDNKPPEPVASSQVAEFAAKYLQALPHVRYTAVGVNFSGIVPCANAGDLLIDRFLKPGVWNAGPLNLTALGVRFAYALENTNLRVAVDAGSVAMPDDTQPHSGILINGNYHTDLPKERALEAALDSLQLFAERSRHFLSLSKSILPLEG